MVDIYDCVCVHTQVWKYNLNKHHHTIDFPRGQEVTCIPSHTVSVVIGLSIPDNVLSMTVITPTHLTCWNPSNPDILYTDLGIRSIYRTLLLESDQSRDIQQQI